MINEFINFNNKKWQRINMRQVNNLIGVEFIHNLYNQHIPRINSIRFRNTLTIWNNGVVNSFAPIKEWDKLNEWLGNRYLNLDKELLKETDLLLKEDRVYFKKLFKKFSKIDFTKLTNLELAYYLIDLQDKVLGELYPVNFVQIESSLTYALKEALSKLIPQKSIDETISKIIFSSELTEFQKEELEFISLCKKWKFLDIKVISKLGMSQEFKKDIQLHSNNFGYLHCAYGEKPKNTDDYMVDYNNRFFLKKLSAEDFKKKIYEKKLCLRKLKSNKVKTLANLLSKGGTFRDHNKANLGKIQEFRFRILDVISKRNLEKRDNLNYYLLSEILNLIKTKKKVSVKKIKERKKEGVILIRNEYLDIFSDVYNFLDLNSKKKNIKNKKIIKGVCASPGNVKGVCKIIYSKKDIKKMNNGDIMVAIGTDFDLMDIIYKSSAVITEEGGLLSHASVVCREMNKPCCIGVKNATKFLKDGDLINLNATKGIIRCIN